MGYSSTIEKPIQNLPHILRVGIPDQFGILKGGDMCPLRFTKSGLVLMVMTKQKCMDVINYWISGSTVCGTQKYVGAFFNQPHYTSLHRNNTGINARLINLKIVLKLSWKHVGASNPDNLPQWAMTGSTWRRLWLSLAYADMLICFNTLRPRQNGRHFPDDIFKCIFLNENVWISINISLKFVPRGPINDIPTLVQVMA